MTTRKLSLAELLTDYGNTSNVEEVLKLADTYRLPYPTAPKKPILKHVHTSGEAKNYAESLEDYEKLKGEYDYMLGQYQLKEGEVNDMIKAFLWEITGLNQVQGVNKNKVWHKAYEDGHSAGWYEIWLQLNELMDIFRND